MEDLIKNIPTLISVIGLYKTILVFVFIGTFYAVSRNLDKIIYILSIFNIKKNKSIPTLHILLSHPLFNDHNRLTDKMERIEIIKNDSFSKFRSALAKDYIKILIESESIVIKGLINGYIENNVKVHEITNDEIRIKFTSILTDISHKSRYLSISEGIPKIFVDKMESSNNHIYDKINDLIEIICDDSEGSILKESKHTHRKIDLFMKSLQIKWKDIDKYIKEIMETINGDFIKNNVKYNGITDNE